MASQLPIADRRARRRKHKVWDAYANATQTAGTAHGDAPARRQGRRQRRLGRTQRQTGTARVRTAHGRSCSKRVPHTRPRRNVNEKSSDRIRINKVLIDVASVQKLASQPNTQHDHGTADGECGRNHSGYMPPSQHTCDVPWALTGHWRACKHNGAAELT